MISPPGSPPVGWEPIREDPPNRDTLADDLMKALGALRDEGKGVESNIPRPLTKSRLNSPSFTGLEIPMGQGETISKFNLDGEHQDQGSERHNLPPPTLVIPPSTQPAQIRRAMPGIGRNEVENAGGEVQVPGVTVQSYDPVDAFGNSATNAVKTGMSISSVKATVESMRGGSSEVSGLDHGGEATKVDGQALPKTAMPTSSSGSLGGGLGGEEDVDGSLTGGGKRITPTGRPPLAGRDY